MLLFLLAFLSGLATIFSPCIWPVLPIILSYSAASSSRHRPLGIVTGIVLSFSLLTLFLSTIIKLFNLDPGFLRLISVIVIIFFGLSLLVPRLNQFIEVFISRLTSRFSSHQSTDNNFASGFVTGLSLGILWTPCAGPILATVVALSATNQLTLTAVITTFFYVLGIGTPLLILSLVGQSLLQKTRGLNKYTPITQKIFGIVIILGALLIYFNVTTLIPGNFIPSFETSSAVKNQLSQLRTFSSPPAVDISGGTNWLNSDTPLTISQLKGKVILVDFWTYTCINCIRTLPHLTSWYSKYKDLGFVIVGVHTPEFAFEKETLNVQKAIVQFGIKYPIVQDNNYAIWNAYQNSYWPAEYLIDQSGKVVHTHFGEGKYDITEKLIQDLLKVNMSLDSSPDTTPRVPQTPETYLNSVRGVPYPFLYSGKWDVNPENFTAISSATLDYQIHASKAFLVMRPPLNKTGTVKIFLDNKFQKEINVDTDKLYTLIDLPNIEDHLLHLEFSDGISAFAFTFG